MNFFFNFKQIKVNHSDFKIIQIEIKYSSNENFIKINYIYIVCDNLWSVFQAYQRSTAPLQTA